MRKVTSTPMVRAGEDRALSAVLTFLVLTFFVFSLGHIFSFVMLWQLFRIEPGTPLQYPENRKSNKENNPGLKKNHHSTDVLARRRGTGIVHGHVTSSGFLTLPAMRAQKTLVVSL
jgi:hypothetical protein